MKMYLLLILVLSAFFLTQCDAQRSNAKFSNAQRNQQSSSVPQNYKPEQDTIAMMPLLISIHKPLKEPMTESPRPERETCRGVYARRK